MITELLECRSKALDWVLGHQNPDGSLGDPAEGFHAFRAPWSFIVGGRTDAAIAYCAWVRDAMLTPDGLDGPYRVLNDAYAYRDATLIVGAHLARQYDLSLGLMPRLLSWQDPVSGGFHNDRTADGGMSDRMDVPFACGGGLACLATGHLDEARAVYRFLDRIYAAQAQLPERFYYAWSKASQRAITEFPEDETFWCVVDNRVAREQRWTVGGIAAGFLCRLYLCEPRPEYLDLARRYQSFSMAATSAQFDYAQVCKSSWGSALLYQITGDDEYLSWSRRMGEWYIETQNDEGFWRWKGFEALGPRIEAALEFAMHVDTLIGGLAARPLSAAGRRAGPPAGA